MKNEFTKSDLKNRMVVETRCHLFYMVVDNWLIGVSDSLDLQCYSNKLFHYYDKYDIIKVYGQVNRFDGFIPIHNIPNGIATKSVMALLWERSEVKEVTVEEVEQKFGCKVKIVESDS